MKVYAVIPAYNEEKTIQEVVKKTRKYCPVIVVDDGSDDKTAKLAKKSRAILIKHIENKGYGKSLIDGIKNAIELNADYVITLDSDGQHNPDDIPKFIEALEGGYDIVSGSRFLDKKSWGTKKRMFAIKLLTYQAKIFSRLKLTDIQSGFRGYNTRIFRKMKLEDSGMGFSVELPIKAKKKGYKFIEVPIRIRKPHSIKTLQDALKQGFEVSLAIVRHTLF